MFKKKTKGKGSESRRGGGKKGGMQIQIEIKSQEEWDAILEKPGLIVADIYSPWCGPCIGMQSNLKKIRLDVGDKLILISVRADVVDCLERFLHRSEPTWMFIAGGKMLQVVFGVNAPLLTKVILQELKNEEEATEGLRERGGTSFFTLTSEEEIMLEIKKQREENQQAIKEAKEKKIQDEDFQETVNKLIPKMKFETVLLFLPYLYEGSKNVWSKYTNIGEILGEPFFEKWEETVSLSLEAAQQLMNIYDEEEVDDLKEHLENGKFLGKVVAVPKPQRIRKPEENEVEEMKEEEIAIEVEEKAEEEDEGDEVEKEMTVTTQVFRIINGPVPPDDYEVVKIPDGVLGKIFQEFGEISSLSGIWVPETDEEKAIAALQLFPLYCEEVMNTIEPLPPHLVAIYDAVMYPKLEEILQKYETEILKLGFFNSNDPDIALQIAENFSKFESVSPKTGTEKLVIVIDYFDPEAIAAFAEFAPSYISETVEEGLVYSDKFFPLKKEEENDAE